MELANIFTELFLVRVLNCQLCIRLFSLTNTIYLKIDFSFKLKAIFVIYQIHVVLKVQYAEPPHWMTGSPQSGGM